MALSSGHCIHQGRVHNATGDVLFNRFALESQESFEEGGHVSTPVELLAVDVDEAD